MKVRTRRKNGFTVIELLIVTVVVALLFTSLLPAMQAARMNARLTSCKNNLKQLGIAMHNYHDTFATLPPGWVSHTPYPQEKTSFGWQVMLLPYVEQWQLYDQINFQIGYGKDAFASEKDDPTFLAIKHFRCPDDVTEAFNTMRGGFATSNYSAVHGNLPLPRWTSAGIDQFWPGTTITPINSNGLFCWNSSVRFRDVLDGLSNTFMVGERSISSAAGIWPGVRSNNTESDQVTACNVGNEINSGLDAFSSQHGSGALFVFGDGSVRFISEKIDSRHDKNDVLGTFQKLGQKDDGQVTNNF